MTSHKFYVAAILAVVVAIAPPTTATQAQAQTAPARTPNTSASLPNLGDGATMAPAAERRLGDRIARELYRDPD